MFQLALSSEPRQIGVAYQPVVDLRRAAVCGYAALARFDDDPQVLGCPGTLEAQVMQAALVAQPLLVRDRFIAVSVAPAALLSAEVQAVLGAAYNLRRLVVEITGRPDGTDPGALRRATDALRAAGATIARHVSVSAADVLAGRADQRDAELIAKAIDTDEQLDALVALGVPFGRGSALGRPAPALAELRPDVRARIQRHADPSHAATLATLAEPAAPATTLAAGGATPLCFDADTPVEAAAQRAMARPPSTRFDPIVVLDDDGTCAALVPIERLVNTLAR